MNYEKENKRLKPTMKGGGGGAPIKRREEGEGEDKKMERRKKKKKKKKRGNMERSQCAANSHYNRGLEMAKERDLSGAALYRRGRCSSTNIIRTPGISWD